MWQPQGAVSGPRMATHAKGAAQDTPFLADGLMVVEMMMRSSGKTGIFWVQLWPLMGPRGLYPCNPLRILPFQVATLRCCLCLK